MNHRVQELDLTNAQAHVIGYLARAQEPPCARDFEERFGLSHATVSGILSRMEAKGFIELRPDAADRRIKRIGLLERGRACSQNIGRQIEENEQLMTAGFTQAELAQFREYLTRTIENLTNTRGDTQ